MPTALLRRVLVATATLLFLLVPATAHANYKELLKDACRDEKVDGTYGQKDYRDALDNLPADADQYTDCRGVLRAAQLAAAGAEGAGLGSPAGLLPAGGGALLATATPKEKAAVEQAVTKAAEQGGAPVTVGGEVLEPSALGAGRPVAASVSDLPAPLLLALGLVAIAALAAISLVIVPRVRARRHL